MSKSKKKPAKKSFNLKKLIIIIAIVIGCAGAGVGVTALVKAIANKSRNSEISVAFYNLPESVTSPLKDYISENSEVKTSFTNLQPAAFDVKRISQKYDLFFSWNGQSLDILGEKSEKIGKKCYSQQPTSFSRNTEKKLAVALDHYEIAYNIQKINECKVEYPQSFEELERFLSDMSGYVFCPFIFEGSKDDVLLAFLSCIIEGKAGSDGYKAFLEEAAKNPDFNSLVYFTIPAGKGKSITLASVLEDLKTWPAKGFTHPAWYSATRSDLDIFMDTDQVAVVFTSLSSHREMPYRNVSKYEACRFPTSSEAVSHGVIAPTVACVKLNNSSIINNLLATMVSPEAQEFISFNTMLAPTSSQGQAFDRQADDVRFWAAACKDGPLPDLYNAVFQNDKENATKFAAAVRDYLKN